MTADEEKVCKVGMRKFLSSLHCEEDNEVVTITLTEWGWGSHVIQHDWLNLPLFILHPDYLHPPNS